MKNARLLGALAALAVLLVLTAAAPAFAADLPLVASTTFATAGHDGFADVTTAGSGVVYAAGYAGRTASGGASKLLLVKYVDDGAALTRAWLRLAGGKRPLRAVKVAVDALGNVVVVANRGSPASSSGTDIAVLKYSAAGDLLWTATYDAPAHGADEALGLTLDEKGNAIICGSSHGDRTRRDFVTLKVTADGRVAWVRRFRGPGDGDEARDITVDEAGNVYVAGRTSERWSASNPAIRVCSVVVKYSPEGLRRWVRLDDNAKMTSGSAIVYSPAQDVLFFAGNRNWMKGYGVELLIRMIETDNTVDHAWAFVGGGGTGNWPTAVAVDAAGVPVVAGVAASQAGVWATLTGLTATGEDHWGDSFQSPLGALAWSKFSDVAVSADGRMIAAGETSSALPTAGGGRPTTFLVRFSAALPVTDPLDYIGSGDATSRDSCAATAIGDRGMYAAGRAGEEGDDSDAVLLKF